MHFLIYGQNTYSSFHKLQDLKQAFLKKTKQAGEVVIFADDYKIEEIINNAKQQGLFVVPKLIIIYNYLLKTGLPKPRGRKKTKVNSDDPEEQLINLLNTNTDNLHYLFYEQAEPDKKFQANDLWNLLNQTSKNVFYFPALKNIAELTTWVKDYVKKNNGQIETAAINKLLNFCQADLWLIASELDKLLAFANQQSITEENVLALTSPIIPDDIFGLISAIIDKQEKLALKLLNQQLANELNELALLSLLAREFRLLFQIKAGLEQKKSVLELGRDVGLPDFIVRKKLALAQKLSVEQLKNAYFLLLKAESSLKTSTLPPATLLTLLIDTLQKQL